MDNKALWVTIGTVGLAIWGVTADSLQIWSSFYKRPYFNRKDPIFSNSQINGLNQQLKDINDCKVTGLIVKINENLDKKSNEIKFQIHTRGSFNRSKYFINDLRQKNCISQAISFFVENIKIAQNREFGFLIDARFIGYADGIPSDNGGFYKNEFNSLVIPNAYFNSHKKTYFLKGLKKLIMKN